MSPARHPLQVTSDGAGLGAAWHLAAIEVLDTKRQVTTSFPCNAWLDGSADPASLQQTLLPEGQGGAAGAGLVQYQVVVYTSDIRWVGHGRDERVCN